MSGSVMRLNRRAMLISTGTAAAIALCPTVASGRACEGPFVNRSGARCRVMLVNDLSGDIDGLFATVHAVLSTSTDLRAIVGANAAAKAETAAKSAQLAREILRLTGKAEAIAVYEGAVRRLIEGGQPQRSPGVDAIIAEARRTDSTLPLYVTVGGGLTEVASALMLAPDIAERFTLIWIGGNAYPAGGGGEYNFNIDPVAARYIYNETKLSIWQVPSDVYATCQVSAAELQTRVRPCGPIGEWLYQRFEEGSHFGKGLNTGEGWTLGDSPLVLLTALTAWIPSGFGKSLKYENTGSSHFQLVPTPRLTENGAYEPQTAGRAIRIYTSADTRMMFDDFFSKLDIQSCAARQ